MRKEILTLQPRIRATSIYVTHDQVEAITMADWIVFFFNDPATTEIYTAQYTLSLHDALPIFVLRDLVDHGLEPLLELSTVLGARDDGGHVEREHAMILERVGTLPARDQLCQPLDDRRLADAGLPDQDRVVFLAARQDFHHALDFLLPSDRRIERAFGRELRQVTAEVVERRSLGFLFAFGRRRLGAGATAGRCRGHLAAEQPQRFGARLLQVHARVGQDLRGDPLLFAQQSEQQVLGADVRVIELPRLAHRQLEHLLGA